MYAGWLKESPGSAEAPVIFLRYAGLEQSLPSLIEQGARFLQTSRRSIKSSAAAAWIARLFEIAGRTEEARDAYLAAFQQGEPAATLESAFLLSLEMNDMNAVQSELEAIKDSRSERVEFLRACLSFQNGDSAPAGAVLLRIADSTSDQEIALKALWMSCEVSRRAADSSAMQEAVKRLQARFPRSPEYLMAQAGGSTTAPGTVRSVIPLEVPGRFFVGAQDSPALMDSTTGGKPSPLPEGGSTPAVDTQPVPPTTLSVQAGSFQMKENADDLVGELTGKGFSPNVRIDSRQGKQLYRVMAGSGLAPEDARLLLDKLRAAGFSGFLLRDQ